MSASPRGSGSAARPGAHLGRLFVVALLLRVAALVATGSAPAAEGQTPWEWGGEAPTLAASLYEGRGYGDPWGHGTGPSSWLTPPYPWLLAQAMAVGGGVTAATAWIVFLAQSAFSAATCVWIALFARRLGHAGAGALGGWMFALYPIAIWNATGVVWDTTLVAWGVAAFLWLLLARGPSPRGAAVSGLGYGALLFLNPAPLALLPAIAGWFLLRGGRRAGAAVVAFCGAALLVCLPWMLRNQRVLGTLQLRPNFGAELRMGNHDAAHGRPVPWETHPSHVPEELASYRALGEAAYGRDGARRAWTWIAAHPGRFAALTARRAMLYWVGEPPNVDPRRSGDLDPGADPGSWLKYVCYALSGAGALLALCWIPLRGPERLLLIGGLLLSGVPYYLTHVSERYRFPVDPVIVLLDAWLVLRLWRPQLARLGGRS